MQLRIQDTTKEICFCQIQLLFASPLLVSCVFFRLASLTCDGKVLQPVSNQYNITEKIKEANHKLFTSTTTDPISQRRPSAQRVRFKDKLVEYESEDNDKMTPDIGEHQQQQQRIESVEKYDDEDSVDLDEKEVEEITSEIEELMSTESGVEPYDDNDFETESHPINEGDENSTPDLSAFNNAKKKKLTTLAKVVGFGGGRKTPQSESSEEKIMLQRIRTIKECCQFKESNEYKEKLPNYNGFNSRYGLSKEEIERRESGRSRRKQDRSDKQLQEHQQKELVARINEEVS